MPRAAKVAVEKPDERKRATSIIPEAIQDEYAAVPSDLARWNMVAAQADEEVRRAELELDVWEAERRLKVVEDWRAAVEAEAEVAAADKKKAAPRPPGEDKIDAVVFADPDYRRRREAGIEAQRRKADALGMLDAIRAKKDMLISLGAHIRIELERDPSLRDRGAGRPR